MSGIAVMSTLVAASMLLLALVANDAREDANRRRSQAEDLISFMVGDLREKLEPVGRLDVLDAVGDKSLDYFASLDDEELTPETLLRRAEALRQIGEVRMFQGKLKEAEDAFRLSHDQARRIRASHHDLSAVDFELCQSLFYMGYAQYERGNFEDAKEHFASYLDIAQRLRDREPDDERYLREVSYAHSNLGSLELKLDDLPQARTHFAATLSIQRGLVEANPDDVQALKDYVETISWLGEIANREMDVLEAMKRFGQEYELRQKIVAELDDRHQEEKLADAAILLAHQEALAGRLEDSVTHWNDALVIGHRLVDYDPENVYWRRLRAYSALGLSKAHALENHLKRSAEHLEFARGEFSELRTLDGESMVARIDFLDATVQTALTSRLAGDQDRFRQSVRKGMSLVTSAEYLAVSVDSYALIAQLHLLRGDLFELQGLDERAAASWSAGLGLTSSQKLSSKTLFASLLELTLMQRLHKASSNEEMLIIVARTGISEQHLDRVRRVLIEGVSRRVDTTGGQHGKRDIKYLGYSDT
jgi:tetratricopeptide (TPR) repeat protein